MKNLVVLDCEIYQNYSLFAFKNIDNDKIITIEIKGEDSCLSDYQHQLLSNIINNRKTFGFNSRNYDMLIIIYALKRKTCLELYNMSSQIISEKFLISNFFHELSYFKNHFDIQEPAPGVMISLKLYAARMHSKKLQDLPIDPDCRLSEIDMENIKLYCINDLDITIELYRKIEDRIKLRVDMSKQYKQCLMSKSDAQIAEAVIKSELKKKNHTKKLYAKKLNEDATFKYDVPNFINFENDNLKNLLNFICSHDFELDKKGSIKLPDELKKLKINLGQAAYQLGLGGIHSTEKKQTIIPNANQILIDKDVVSYYPSIILNLRLYPKHLGSSFLNVYKNIVETRIKAKRENNKTLNESLKIVINGSFGKLGNKYSALYSPDLMIKVTLTGQLSLLMLIEQLEKENISVVSANTDGFVSLLDKNKYDDYKKICEKWELNTNFELEETSYKALYSRDVNNYLAVTENNTKKKGIFAINALSKNPQANICLIAVCELLISNTSIEKTIKKCDDLTQFLTVRRVSGGGLWRGEYLGRVVRWIYSTRGDDITYKKNGNKVAKSNGARPIMTLEDKLPKDIDYKRYIDEAISILEDIGYTDL